MYAHNENPITKYRDLRQSENAAPLTCRSPHKLIRLHINNSGMGIPVRRSMNHTDCWIVIPTKSLYLGFSGELPW